MPPAADNPRPDLFLATVLVTDAGLSDRLRDAPHVLRRRPSPAVRRLDAIDCRSWTCLRRNNVRVQRAAGRAGRWSSRTASAATRTCGASSRPLSRPTTGSCSSITWAPAASDLAAYDPERYGSLDGLRRRRAGDLPRARARGRGLRRALGQLDDRRARGRARSRSGSAQLVLVGPVAALHRRRGLRRRVRRARTSTELLESLESNFLGWSSAMAPAIMGNADRPELGEELTDSFCRTDPEIAARFARVDVHLRQPRRPGRRSRVPDAGAAVQRRRDRARRGRRVRARAASRLACSCGWRRPGTART